eukprot:scaffold228284_cov36-Tisochrysis_lutea.AAC.1
MQKKFSSWLVRAQTHKASHRSLACLINCSRASRRSSMLHTDSSDDLRYICALLQQCGMSVSLGRVLVFGRLY